VEIFAMTKSMLMASTAIGLLLCIAPANSQMQPKEEKAAPSQQRELGAAQQGEPKQKTEPKGKGTAEKAPEPKDKA
jgi:hypothetical protein